MNTTDIIPAPVEKTSFPVAKAVAERNRLSTFKMTWQQYRKEAGITDKTEKAEVKKHQAQYTAQRNAAVHKCRAIAAQLVSDSAFGRITVDQWTDKGGNRRFAVSASDKAFSVKDATKDAQIAEKEQKLASARAMFVKLGLSEEEINTILG